MTGFLSPRGKMTVCKTYDHGYCAEKICKSLKTDRSYVGYEAEDFLLSKGYVKFTSRGAFMAMYKGERKDDIPMTLTERQLAFIKENEDNWNNEDQKRDVEELMERSSMHSVFLKRDK